MSARRAALILGLVSALFFPPAAPAQQVHISSSAHNIQLLTPEAGWALFGCGLFWTADGGNHWRNISPPAKWPECIASVFFLDTYNGWALLAAPNYGSGEPTFELASTGDAGADWSMQPVIISGLDPRATILGPYGRVDFVDAMHGWMSLAVVGSSNFNPGIMVETEDGGGTWNVAPGPRLRGDTPYKKTYDQPEKPGPGVWGDVRFVTAEDGWLAGGPGDEHLYVTHDGSKSWQEVRLKPPPQVGAAIYPTYDLPVFEEEQNGYLPVAYTGPESTPSQLVIYSTGDGGKTWHPDSIVAVPGGWSSGVPTPTAIVGSTAIVCTGPAPNGVTVVSVPLTGPGGRTRTIALVGGFQISFADSTHGWVLTQTSLLSTTDGGAAWTNITPGGGRKGRTASQNQPVSSAPVSGVAAPLQSVNPAASPAGSVHRSVHLGFDTCQARTAAEMQGWWTYSPYYDANIYIGGASRSCTQPNLTSSWVTQVSGQGWGLIPTWPGLQAPCTGYTNTFSSDPGTAETQGESEAISAENAAKALGLSRTVIYYDIENYLTTNTQCGAAVTAFVSGWVSQLHADGYSAGVYANPDPAEYDISVASPLPDEIWVAKYDGRATIWGLGDLEDGLWPSNQRAHQYLESTETYNGLKLTIDRDIEDAPVAGADGAKSFTWTLSELQYPGAVGTGASGINDWDQTSTDPPVFYEGQIVGDYCDGSQISQCYGFLDVAGTFSSIAYPGGVESVANGISNPGQIAGGYLNPSDSTSHGFLYLVSQRTYAAIDYPGAIADTALGINDDAQVVGRYELNSSGAAYGFLMNGSAFSTIDYPGATITEATAINGVRQIVGDYEDSKGNTHGFLYDGGTFATIDCKGATVTEPAGISNNGQVVGECYSSPPQYTGFVYDTVHGTFTTVIYQGQPTVLQGINDAAQMVGYYFPGSTSPSQGLGATQ